MLLNSAFRRLATASRFPSSLGSSVSRQAFHTSPVVSLATRFHLPDPSLSTDDCMQEFAPKLTKIVATIGPTSEQLPVLQEVVRHGMRIMRLNFSHATREEVELRTSNLAKCQGRHSFLNDAGAERSYNLRAILLDTKGPEIRSGKLQNDHSGHETIKLEQGKTIILDTSDQRREEGSTTSHLYIDYANLHKALKPGMKVLLDDGAIVLTVKSVSGEHVECSIDNSGELRSRAGVNLPGAQTDLPAMSEKDKVDIKYGMTKDIDYVAASFVQNAAGVHEIRDHIEACAKELGWDDSMPRPLIISKIESLSALTHFDEILEASDGIMVARGDLGVELPLQQVTNAQKEMVAACNTVGKPVIVATQMLESMAKNPRPTRAEVSDVTNAIYDGADCVMLSGESAKGKYPVESVKMMNEIILSAERFARDNDVICKIDRFEGPATKDASIARAAVSAAHTEHVKAILALTTHGSLPALLSAYRPQVPILTFCANGKVGRQLMIYRGVHPVLSSGTKGKMEEVVQSAKNMGFLRTGDDVVVVSVEESDEIGRNPTMKIVSVP